MYLGFHVKYPLFLQILMKLEFFGRFSKDAEISNFTKIRAAGSEFHADGERWTYVTKLIVAFRNDANGPKSRTVCYLRLLQRRILRLCSTGFGAVVWFVGTNVSDKTAAFTF